MTTFALINLTLLVILAATAMAIARIRALYEATMLTALLSLVTATLFVVLDAVDVAFTEAAVGVGISTVLLLGVLALTRSWEAVTPRRRRLPGLAAVILAGGALGYASQDLPAFGAADSPVQSHPLTDTYLYQSRQDIGIPNTVTSVLASYRALDTLGELVVVFTAGVAVLSLLGPLARPEEAKPGSDFHLADYRVIRVITALLIPFILLFALYVLFHGEYGPGGGFQAGVIFASGAVLYSLVFGLDRAQYVVPRRALWSLVSLGPLAYVGLGVATMMLGGSFLDYAALSPGHPEAGQHLGILIVEASIGATVSAVMAGIFFSFASRGVASREAARAGVSP
jgi:multicomponent Na+:H+ antiporter subunit B